MLERAPTPEEEAEAPRRLAQMGMGGAQPPLVKVFCNGSETISREERTLRQQGEEEVRRGASRATTPSTPSQRGRGRGFANNSKTFSTPNSQTSTSGSRRGSPAPARDRNLMNTKYAEFQTLKQSREEERAKAIRDGFLADPEKKTSLDKAITPVGTCTDMCPRFERVERIVQNMVDRAEKERDDEDGKDWPAEDRMVKRFRRSAAGYDEQLPSDIRTPETLKRTLDYLFDKVIGGAERLATVQKFVWDRTRGIRNDFSIQQVTNAADVKLAVECYERIARFHVLSLHQLSNPDNLLEGEHFDAFQEREQLNNTLLSLMYYYDDHRDRVHFPNEAEFRAYLVIFEIVSQTPNLEDRMQSWPASVLNDPRVKTALKLYAAAGNTTLPLGPLQPLATAAIAQGNGGSFWNVLASRSVPYIMACLAEMYFAEVRFAALDALWRSLKQSPLGQQARSREWSLHDVTDFLGFDSEDQTREFCEAFELSFATDENGGGYLDLRANSAMSLDKSSTPGQQVFSHKFVEKKRYRRTFTAVVNGVTVADAIRSGAIEPDEGEHGRAEYDPEDDAESMFVAEDQPAPSPANSLKSGSSLDPTASVFTPAFGNTPTSSVFGKPATESPFGTSTASTGFGSTSNTHSEQGTTASTFGKPSDAGGFGFSSTTTPSGFPSTFGKPADSGAFGSSAANSPSRLTTPFGNSTTLQPQSATSTDPQPQPATSTPGVFATPAAPVSTELAAGGFASSTAHSGWNFGQSASASQPKQPATAAFGTNLGSTTTAPPSLSSGSTFQPLFGQQPASQGSISPVPAKREDKTTTNPFPFASFQSPAASNPPSQISENKPGTSAFTPPAWLTSQSQPTQPTLGAAPSLPSFTKPSQEPPTTSTGFVKTPFKPFFDSKKDSQPSLDTASPQQHSQKPTLTPTPASRQPQRSTTPPHSPRQTPAQSVFTQADRQRLAANVARIGFTQPNGLLHSFLEFALRELLTTAFKQHQQELRDAAIASVRGRILARKFGVLWRQRAWNNSLNRRAKNRRQLFAETIRAEQARTQRSDEELEEILKAAQESRRLQKEVEEVVKMQKEPSTMPNGNSVVKLAGQKRKSFSGQDLGASTISSSNRATSVSGHKRSKTMSTSRHSSPAGSGAPFGASFRSSTSRPPQHVSIFSRASTLGRSTSNSDLRKSASSQKLDVTRTDYFRLKAMGLDPDTPIVPDTKETLAFRRRREAEERQASINRANRRLRTSISDQSPPAAMPPPPLPRAQTPETQQTPRRTPTPAPTPIEDDFLKQIREARGAMAEQTEWFKQQAVTLEQEIAQEDEFRKSQSSLNGASSPVSSSGLAKAMGYEYLPANTKPGFPLSRTELRIRQTGAHGLATKPPRSTPDYVAVAMSKKSALSYSGGSQSHSSPGRKRSHNDVEPSDEISNAHKAALHALKRPRAASNHTQVADSPEKPRSTARKSGGNGNPYQLLQSVGPDQGEGEEDLYGNDADTAESNDEEEEHSGQSAPGSHPAYFEQNGNHADDEDEEELDEEDEDENEESYLEEEEGYEDEDDEGELDEEDHEGYEYQYPVRYLQGESGQDGDEYEDEDAATPASNPQVSRAASSAPGASVDDAFVIDDSD
ncbi:hypothetical protein A1O7_03060 [Cladophialophora yegresii CBS 114405]|uniref:SAC3/GANP/THP3 conserved domain-containing protein n=1 Tax=Cladophialophora yegresii CBS 114405 TaxID=1182544 RepID=W9W3I8_9EURO|nr:uncharacterized protein A1O7_03060 [Cladophialophora yegresii CBS 114405]EXJ62622.1 hypothetical protein A1O7_03060 [Cladophialophora yegresii CBS 114405]